MDCVSIDGARSLAINVYNKRCRSTAASHKHLLWSVTEGITYDKINNRKEDGAIRNAVEYRMPDRVHGVMYCHWYTVLRRAVHSQLRLCTVLPPTVYSTTDSQLYYVNEEIIIVTM